MTPAERARQIDKEEFAAECAAIRQRAYAYVEERRQQTPQQPLASTRRTESDSGRTSTLHTYNGESLTVVQWAERLGVTSITLYVRRRKLGSMQAAIALGGAQRRGRKPAPPGVVSDFSGPLGTGGGRHA